MRLPNPHDVLPEIVRRLVEAAKPEKIILFGSYARKEAGPDSDLDLLIIESKVVSKYHESIRLKKALRGILVPIDLLVISSDEYEARSMIKSTVYFWARTEGKTLYEAA